MSETLYTRQRENSEGSQDDDAMEDNDVWDDSLLIKAYNKAVDMAKEKIAKKLHLENGVDPTKEASSSTPNTSPTKKLAEKSPSAPAKSNPTYKMGEMDRLKNMLKPAVVQWKAGSHCRATFSEDGNEYEAVILEMFTWKGSCQVMYIGYNNDEEVDLTELKQSKGDKARKAQEVEARQSQTHNKYQETRGIAMNQTQPEVQQPYEGGDVGVIPPPPPPNVMAHFPKDQNDALSAMLMSWYMSGYHTGYYQGLTRSQCSKCSNGECAQTTSRLN